jgi:hypothetical protein
MLEQELQYLSFLSFSAPKAQCSQADLEHVSHSKHSSQWSQKLTLQKSQILIGRQPKVSDIKATVSTESVHV